MPRLDLNKATERDLANYVMQLGPARASRVTKYRNAHGDILTPDDLASALSISPRSKLFATIRKSSYFDTKRVALETKRHDKGSTLVPLRGVCSTTACTRTAGNRVHTASDRRCHESQVKWTIWKFRVPTVACRDFNRDYLVKLVVTSLPYPDKHPLDLSIKKVGWPNSFLVEDNLVLVQQFDIAFLLSVL